MTRHIHPGIFGDERCEVPDDTTLDWRRVAWTALWILVGILAWLALGGVIAAAFGWQA